MGPSLRIVNAKFANLAQNGGLNALNYKFNLWSLILLESRTKIWPRSSAQAISPTT